MWSMKFYKWCLFILIGIVLINSLWYNYNQVERFIFTANVLLQSNISSGSGIVQRRQPLISRHNVFNVTRILHQSWKTKSVPLQFVEFTKSWRKECYPDWSYKLWTDTDNLEFISKHYPWFLSHYKSYPREIYRADVVRYFYMFHYGGIYTDLDNECLRPFEHLLANYSLVFGAMNGNFGPFKLREGYVQNSFMYSRPRNPFWMRLVREIMKTTLNMLPEYTTGPVPLNKLISITLAEDARIRNSSSSSNSSLSKLKVFEPVYFCPFSWLNKEKSDKHCKDKGRMTMEDLNICRTSMLKQGSFVVQYHAHNWR